MEVEAFFAFFTFFSLALASFATREESFASGAAFLVRRLEHIRAAFCALDVLQLGLGKLRIEPDLGNERGRVSCFGVRALATTWKKVIAFLALVAIDSIYKVVASALASDVEPVILVSAGSARREWIEFGHLIVASAASCG